MEKYYKLQNILESLLVNIKRQDFLTFFRKMSILEITDKKVIFGCFSDFMKGNLEAKLYDVIFDATKKEFSNIEKIEFEVDSNIENPSNKNVIDCGVFIKNFSKKSTNTKKLSNKNIEALITKKTDKNLRYTLENFVV
jgi:chromosomal replication initiation ATPase DnaA